MKRNVTRLICAVLALMFSLVSIIGCTKTDTKSTSGTTTKETFKTDAGTVIPKMDLKNKTVKVLGIDQPQFAEDGITTKFFEKYYGGKIEQDVTAPSDFYSKLAMLVSSGDAPDLVGTVGGFPSLCTLGLIQPVDGLIDYSLDIYKNQKFVYDSFVYDGKHYYLPWTTTISSYVFYNKKIFEDEDITTPKALYTQGKWDWNAFKDMAIKLTINKKGSTTPERYGAAMCIWHDARFAFITGQNIIKINGKDITSNLNNTGFERAFNFLSDLTLNLKVANSNRDANQVQDIFNQGKAAMLLGPSFWWGTDSFAADLKKAKSVEWAPYPKDPSADKYYIPGNLVGYYMPKGASNKDGAIALMYAANASLTESYAKGTELYNKSRDKWMKTWGQYYTNDEYDSFNEYNKTFEKLSLVTDPYRDMADVDSLYTLMLGVNKQAPLTFQQAVGVMDPKLKSAIETIKNPKLATASGTTSSASTASK